MAPHPDRTWRSRLRRALSVTNVLATIAVFMASGGTAYAAIMLTGSNVKNETLTGADFKNGSVDFMQFPMTAGKVLGTPGDRGPVGKMGGAGMIGFSGPLGPSGAMGPVGETGMAGDKGFTGEKGAPAPRAFTFQNATRSSRISGATTNPSAYESMPSCSSSDPLVNCPGGIQNPDPMAGYRFPRWDFACPFVHCNVSSTASPPAPRMTSTPQAVILTAQNSSGGLLNMPYDGAIVLNASTTFYSQIAYTKQRIECQLQIARVSNGLPEPPQSVGVPVMTSRWIDMSNGAGARNTTQRLTNLYVTGAAYVAAGVFETSLACRTLDDTGTPNFRPEFIEGNMSVLSTRRTA